MKRTEAEEIIIFTKVEIAGLKKRLQRLNDCYDANKRNNRDTTQDEESIKEVNKLIASKTKYMEAMKTKPKEESFKVVTERKPKQTVEDVKRRRAELICCEACGSTFRRSNLAKHKKTQKHIDNSK